MDNFKWLIDTINSKITNPINDNNINWLENPVTLELANLLELSDEEISNMTFSYQQKRLGLTMKDVYRSPWFIYKTIHCCPECLVEEPYVRLDWGLCQSICCIKHKKYLIDRCDCGKVLTTKLVISGRCLCGQVIHLIKSKDVSSKNSLEYQGFLNKFLYETNSPQYNDWITSPSTFFTSVEFLATWIPLLVDKKYIPAVDGFKYDGTAQDKTRLKNKKSISQSVILYCMAHKLLLEWPLSYQKILNLTDEKDEGKLMMFFRYGIKKLVNTPLDEISSEFTKFLQVNKLKIDSNIQLLRLDEAKALISRYKGTAINKEDLYNYSCFLNNERIIFYNSKEIQVRLNVLNEVITKKELQDMWKTSPKATSNIFTSGTLKDVFEFRQGSVTAWGVPKHSLNQFMRNLKERETDLIIDKISLNKTFYWIGPDLAFCIIKGMQQGELDFILNEQAFGETILFRTQCYYFIEKALIDSAKNDGKITIRRVLFILGVKKSDLLYWVDTERLEMLDGSDDITYTSFNSFYQTYVTSYQLAFKTNLSVSRIGKLHRLGKIKAAIGPHNGDGKRYLFLRDDFVSY
jgi:hypothetical protein